MPFCCVNKRFTEPTGNKVLHQLSAHSCALLRSVVFPRDCRLLSRMINMPSGDSLRIFIFDSTRLRSHLFSRYMSTHPDLAPIYHPYLTAAMFGPEHLAQHLEHSQTRCDELQQESKTIFGTDSYASNTTALLESIAKAELGGKIPIANEHCSTFCVRTSCSISFVKRRH